MEGATPQRCRPCSEPYRPVSAVTVAVVVVLAIILICYLVRWLGGRQKDGFVTQRAQEVYSSARELFERTQGNASYSEFKTTVAGGVDPVVYTDVRRLWRSGTLSPEKVQAIL